MAKINWLYTDGTVSNIMRVSALAKGRDLYAITFTYKVDGHYCGGEFKAPTGHGYSEGDKITVGYNPANPDENDLSNKGEWMWWYHVVYCVAIAAAVIFSMRSCSK
jgi:hypothetical protein